MEKEKHYEEIAKERYGVIRAIKKALVFISDDAEDSGVSKEIVARLNSLVEDIHAYHDKTRVESPVFKLDVELTEKYFSELRKSA